jgi:ABC-type sugar transport system, periplasmic component
MRPFLLGFLKTRRRVIFLFQKDTKLCWCMMKRTLNILVSVLVIGLVGFLLYYCYDFSVVQMNLIGTNGTSSKAVRKYHFVVISQNTNDTFWQSVKKGAARAGQEFNVAVEFSGPVIASESEELQSLDIAIDSNVDGIAIDAPAKSQFTTLINKAISKGIAVATIESDDRASRRSVYIGPNSYQAGVEAAMLVSQASLGKARVAMILGGNYAQTSDYSHDKILNGFRETLGQSTGIRIETVITPNAGFFAAEQTIHDILENYPNIDTVVCTSSDDTLQVVHVLIDLNKLGSVRVIGYNDTDQIRQYIKKDDIYGAVVENPEETGYRSIQWLTKNKEGAAPLRDIDTGIKTIIREDITN